MAVGKKIIEKGMQINNNNNVSNLRNMQMKEDFHLQESTELVSIF